MKQRQRRHRPLPSVAQVWLLRALARPGTPPTTAGSIYFGRGTRAGLGPRAHAVAGAEEDAQIWGTCHLPQVAIGGGRGGISHGPLDPEDMLDPRIGHRYSLMTEVTNVRRLHHKNTKALRLAIELSEREASKEVATKVKATRHAKAT